MALILAEKGILPPKEWEHDYNIKDDDGFTVEDYLEEKRLPIPNNWIRDETK